MGSGKEGFPREEREDGKTRKIGTRLTADTCPTCHRLVLAGISADGLLVRLDPGHLPDPATEVDALLHRQSTYAVHGGQAVHRDIHRIAARPAGTEPVHAHHDCTRPHHQPPPVPAAAPIPDTPPF